MTEDADAEAGIFDGSLDNEAEQGVVEDIDFFQDVSVSEADVDETDSLCSGDANEKAIAAEMESDASLVPDNIRRPQLPDPVLVRILDVYKRELHSISSLLADEGQLDKIFELAPKPEPSEAASSEE